MPRKYLGAVKLNEGDAEVLNIELFAKGQKNAEARVCELAARHYQHNNFDLLAVARLKKSGRPVSPVDKGNVLLIDGAELLEGREPPAPEVKTVTKKPTSKAITKSVVSWKSSPIADPLELFNDKFLHDICELREFYEYDSLGKREVK